MRTVIEQLFLNKAKLKKEIEQLQSQPRDKWNEELINAKHQDWDRIEYLIDLFFKSVGI